MVNCKVGIPDVPVESLNQTIDYAEMLKIIQMHFVNPVKLLETLAQKIEFDFKATFKNLIYFYLSIQKMNPPLSAEVESSEIVLEKSYEPKTPLKPDPH